MELKISLNVQDSMQLNEDEIFPLARAMKNDLNEEGFDARLVEEEAAVGSKGAVELGTILLSLIGAGGVAVNLVNVLNTYFNRAPKLEIEFEKNDKKIKISATDVELNKINQTIKTIDKFLRD